MSANVQDKALVAFKEFATREMPWLLDQPRGDKERLLRTTALTSFRRGYDAGLQPDLLAELQNFVFFHDQLGPQDWARAKALIAKVTGEGA